MEERGRERSGGFNATPSGERVHVGFFGMRNAGKSSLVNAVTGQDLAVVSDTPGTTTDPVRKAMELLPVGPVLIVDTPGLDDVGDLGGKRVAKAQRAIDATDVAVLVVDAVRGMTDLDREMAAAFVQRSIPFVLAWNKVDLLEGSAGNVPEGASRAAAFVRTSAATGQGVDELKGAIAQAAGGAGKKRKLASDLVAPGDVVVLVVPIDSAAPKGRLILPQQQVIRDLIEAGAIASVTSVEALPAALAALSASPRLVITDSQAFGAVAAIVPDDVALTSFSILMARYKGTLHAQVAAVDALDGLHDGDAVLIAEGCTHHRQCEDIGTVKLPRFIRQICGTEPRFEFTSGGEFPNDLGVYRAVVHCGGCMLNAREMEHRAQVALEQGVPFTNYGMVIAKANGVLDRAFEPLSASVGDELIRPERDERAIGVMAQKPGRYACVGKCPTGLSILTE